MFSSISQATICSMFWARQVMAGVHQHLGLRPGGLGEEVGHAPVGDVGVIERRLEGLVLDQHGHVLGHGLVPSAALRPSALRWRMSSWPG
jgi:hypothetical protein